MADNGRISQQANTVQHSAERPNAGERPGSHEVMQSGSGYAGEWVRDGAASALLTTGCYPKLRFNTYPCEKGQERLCEWISTQGKT